MSDNLCARCGKPAAGFAEIDGDRYCHEGPSPTCYELASPQWGRIPDGCTAVTWLIAETEPEEDA